MKARIKPSSLEGEIRIPGSKSHMIRALFFGALSSGESVIRNPVYSNDALSAAELVQSLGVELDRREPKAWRIRGGELQLPPDVINVGNSGTSMNLGSALLASLDGRIVLTGDRQIRKRPAQPVLNALMQLGVEAYTLRENGSAPFLLRGPIRGGKTFVDGLISQYASAALIAGSLAQNDSEIVVDRPNETPYIDMTLWWMRSLGVEVEAEEDYSRFFVRSGQAYQPFDVPVPADFSSAAFFLVGAAVSESRVQLMGLDTRDVQGDKMLLDLLGDMGADIGVQTNGADGITVTGGRSLKGTTIDCGATPDSIPILSVLGCAAGGETRLVNIESSRLKETDRPLLMSRELRKMGAEIELTEKELKIKNSKLQGAEVSSYGDHRIAMALCMAGLIAEGETIVDQVESASVSFPGFEAAFQRLGAAVEYLE